MSVNRVKWTGRSRYPSHSAPLVLFRAIMTHLEDLIRIGQKRKGPIITVLALMHHYFMTQALNIIRSNWWHTQLTDTTASLIMHMDRGTLAPTCSVTLKMTLEHSLGWQPHKPHTKTKEFLSNKCRPHIWPREFIWVIITAVFISPQANTKDALSDLCKGLNY